VADRIFNVLFICGGNSARSILAEALLNRHGEGRFKAFSAGSDHEGAVDPEAIKLLDHLGFETSGLRSKSWDEFAAPDSPVMDFIFTVCDDAAGETCPVWPGHPVTAHWGIEDPSPVIGPEREHAFFQALHYLENRISLFVNLPFDKLDSITLKTHVAEIGQTAGASVPRSQVA